MSKKVGFPNPTKDDPTPNRCFFDSDPIAVVEKGGAKNHLFAQQDLTNLSEGKVTKNGKPVKSSKKGGKK